MTAFVHHDVVGLDVAVDNPFRMGCRQGTGHLHTNFQYFFQCRVFTGQVCT